MRCFLLMIAVVALVGCGKKAAVKKPVLPTVEIADPIVEKAIRKQLNKPTGELTKGDFEKVTKLVMYTKRLTDIKGLGEA